MVGVGLTCASDSVAVHLLSLQASSAEARSSNPAGPSHSWLAVGTTAGAVKLYDSATGDLRWTAANANEGCVQCQFDARCC